MIGSPGEQIEPEEGHRGEHAALVGNSVRHYAIECTDAVSRHKEETVAHVINIAHLAAMHRFQSRDLGFQQSTVRIITHDRLPHGKDFDFGEFLSVAFAQTIAFAAFDLESDEFGTAEVFHDFSFDFRTLDNGGSEIDICAFADREDLIKGNFVACVSGKTFDRHDFVVRDLQLLSASADDCVHNILL